MQDEIIARLTKALAGHYEVQEHLGSGGMAYVYLANDVKHERTVAIKVLQPELAASLGAERFLQEIKIAAKLTHPHILPLYDSGNADGLLYYVMPFVEGETLADLLEREKQLGYKDAVQYTKEVADALAYAHARGVVHRDIKPDNIYVTGGHAVVADFGIARALSTAGGNRLTQTGMAVGTPAYMSPEQAMGLTDVDGRSDIYSLGCVLYELIIGQIPFTAPTPQAVMARHSMDMVPRLHIMRDTVPDDLEDAVITAMAKSPADRYRTATDFAQALDDIDVKNVTRAYKAHTAAHETIHRTLPTQQALTPSTPMPVPSLKRQRSKRIAVGTAAVLVVGGLGAFVASKFIDRPGGGLGSEDMMSATNIAVMYFEDVSPLQDLGYVADGITEGLIDELSRVQQLRVVSRNGVAPYRDTALPIDSVARALDAGTIVTGRIDVTDGQLRVTTVLIDGNSGADYDRAVVRAAQGSFLQAHDSVVSEVARILRARLGEEVRLQRSKLRAPNQVAWTRLEQGERAIKDAKELIAQDDGLGAWRALDRADSSLAMAELEDAEWIAPTLQRAIAIGARLVLLDTPEERAEWLARGIGYAERALDIDPNSPEALALRGRLRFALWGNRTYETQVEAQQLLVNAKTDLLAAVRADPSLADAHRTLSQVHYQTGGLLEAALAARRALEADAYLELSEGILRQMFWTTYDLQQFAESRRWCGEGRRRLPEHPFFAECQLWLMTARGSAPDIDRAWELYAENVDLAPAGEREKREHFSKMIVGDILARAGLADSAGAVLRAARGNPTLDPTSQLAFDEAFGRVLLGQEDLAIDLLKQYLLANEEQDHGVAHDGQLHWWWEPLQDHPRFGEIAP